MKKKNSEIRQLYTIWGRDPDSAEILPEYPRPQLVREKWYNLNGLWDYRITKAGCRPEEDSEKGKILVPFSPESALSGVSRQLQPDEWLWYHRTWKPDRDERKNRRFLLHFGAVDQCCTVYVNGRKASVHSGGYTPFSIDITAYAREGENHITVCVRDVSDTSFFGRGKQKLKRGGMYYTAQSGIWQTVWIESVPERYADSVRVEADPGSGRAAVSVRIRGGNGVPESRHSFFRVYAPGQYQEASFDPDEKTVLAESCLAPAVSGGPAEEKEILSELSGSVTVPDVRLWSPEEPWLYYYRFGFGEDTVTGYFAFRTFSVEKDHKGIPRFCLNHRPLFLKGVLDQGYWPDGLYTAPSDEALIFDIREMKRTGFNMARKHAKVEADRWYFHCDRLGMIVWQDIVNGGTPYKDWFVTYLATWLNRNGTMVSDRHRKLLSREDSDGRRQFEKEMKETVSALKEHPSIAAWTLFNEGWGQFDTQRLTGLLKKKDPTRPVDSASGWFDQGCGDFISIHHYFFRLPWRTDGKRAVVLSEIGGYAMHDGEHSACENTYGYRVFEDTKSLAANVRMLLEERERMEEQGLAGFVYTQWSDIEEEVNGIYTYDRKIRKIAL